MRDWHEQARIAYHQQGWTMARIADMFGKTVAGVRFALDRDGFQEKQLVRKRKLHARSRQGKIDKRLITTERQAVIDAVLDAKGSTSAREVGARHGITRSAVIGIWHHHKRDQTE